VHISRRILGTGAIVLFSILAACPKPGMLTSDCANDNYPMRKTKSRIAWTPTAEGGHVEGRVRETTKKAPAVRKAWLLVPGPGSLDTLKVPADSTGTFRSDSLPLGRHQVIIQARWYWAAFDSVDIRADSGLVADVRLEPLPQGWYSCIPH
jgi:hypothetical protein